MIKNNIEKLKTIIEEADLSEYKAIPFWSWNGELKEGELVRQIHEMHFAGMGGFIIHARAGLITEYLGEHWFSCVATCIREAKQLGMKVWLYDENGYPSGFVGGKLLTNDEFRAQFLEYEVNNFFDKEAFVTYVCDKGEYFRANQPISGITEYHAIYLRTSITNTDILNPNVVDAFIKETHEKYFEKFGNEFGKCIEGFFTDEPQYFRQKTPFTRMLFETFNDTSFNLLDGLIYLFIKDERGYEFRTQYYKALNKLYVENYYKKIFDWCTAHNVKLTGHSVEENKLSSQMWCCAGVMSSYEYEHVPAIDSLYKKNMQELAPKQVSSVAAQLGKNIVLTETFAGCGYSVTFKELKSIAESQYFHGISKMCYHLFPYTVANQGKFDFPPFFSRHSDWLGELKEFNEYFNKLGYVIANTEEECSVGILHPMRGVYLDYIRSQDADSVQHLEEEFFALLLELRKYGISYHFIDESILVGHGSIEDGCLLVGNCRYDTVIVLDMKTISSSSLNILQKYDRKLCLLGHIEYVDGKKSNINLNSNFSIEELISNRKIKFESEDGNTFVTIRSGELGKFIFLKNLSSEQSSISKLKDLSKTYKLLDLKNYQLYSIDDEIILEPNGSLILLEDFSENTRRKSSISDITDSFVAKTVTDNFLLLDYVQFSKDGKNFSKPRYYQAVFEELLKENYVGPLSIKQEFVMNDNLPNCCLMIENAKYNTLKLNGRDINLVQSEFDVGFSECDLLGLTVIGKNILEYSIDYYQHEGVQFALFNPNATENMRNCLYYDSSIEPVYIKGNFILEKDYSISRSKGVNSFLPLTDCGFPFFFGTIQYNGKFTYEGGDVDLVVEGKYLSIEILVNKKQERLVYTNTVNITKLLQYGENEIILKVKYGLRNFFGPHHFNFDDEPKAIYPTKFTFRTLWNGDVAENFTDRYKLFPYGIEKIKIIKNEKKECLL